MGVKNIPLDSQTLTVPARPGPTLSDWTGSFAECTSTPNLRGWTGPFTEFTLGECSACIYAHASMRTPLALSG